MADTYTGNKYPQSVVEQIFADVYAEAKTLRDNIIFIDDKHKSNTEVTETTTTVNQKAYNVDGVHLDGSGSENKVYSTVVNLNKFQYDGKVPYSHLSGTRFEKSIAAGAANYVSDEYEKKVLINRMPAIGTSVDKSIWNGATASRKASIAGLTLGAGQGLITGSAQTKVAAMPTNEFNSIPATLLYNNSQAKATPGDGLGDYIKVLTPVDLTAANIAAEYLSMYNTHFNAVPDSSETLHKIFAPLGDKALMVAANKGATTVNPDFVQIGDKFTYNGYEVLFVPMVGFRIFCDPQYLMFLTDLTNDAQSFEQERGSNLADFQLWKSVMYGETFCVNQRYITLYGG